MAFLVGFLLPLNTAQVPRYLFVLYLLSNRMFFCERYCNIAMQCCNIDVQVARSKLQSLLTSCCLKAIQYFENIFGQFILPNNLLKNNECNLIF